MDYIDDMFVLIAWLVSTEDADNPDIGYERRKVSDVKQILNKFQPNFLTKMHIPMEKYHVSHLSTVSPNLMANTQQQTSGAVSYHLQIKTIIFP